MSFEPLGVSVKDAIRAIPCGLTKVYEYINAGDLDTYMVGSRRIVTTASLKRLVAKLIAEQAGIEKAA